MDDFESVYYVCVNIINLMYLNYMCSIKKLRVKCSKFPPRNVLVTAEQCPTTNHTPSKSIF